MARAARDRNISTSGTARKVNDLDFEKADLLVTMDNFNFSELSKLAPNDELKNKIIPFCDFVSSGESEVPDPYYGGASGFEKVLDLLEDGCISLLEHVKQKLP
jgi:protein-tyrosine phosphatase